MLDWGTRIRIIEGIVQGFFLSSSIFKVTDHT
jgi:hypothetical protein